MNSNSVSKISKDDIIVLGNEDNIFMIYIRPYKNLSSNEELFHFMHS